MATIAPCTYCGQEHVFTQCPQVIGIEYFETGAVKRIDLGDRRRNTTAGSRRDQARSDVLAQGSIGARGAMVADPTGMAQTAAERVARLQTQRPAAFVQRPTPPRTKA